MEVVVFLSSNLNPRSTEREQDSFSIPSKTAASLLSGRGSLTHSLTHSLTSLTPHSV